MGRIHEFDQAVAAREPITLRFPRGPVFEFPADINSGVYLGFQRRYGHLLNGTTMPPAVVIPFYEMVFGHLLADLEAALDLAELRWAAGILWAEYMGIVARAPADADEAPAEVGEAATARPT